jgi:hypothetical protein
MNAMIMPEPILIQESHDNSSASLSVMYTTVLLTAYGTVLLASGAGDLGYPRRVFSTTREPNIATIKTIAALSPTILLTLTNIGDCLVGPLAATAYAALRFAVSKPRLISASAICTALRAAPLRRLSDTTHMARPFSTVASSRMREI